MSCLLVSILVLGILAIIAVPFALIIALGIGLIWLTVWLLLHHTMWGILLIIVLVLIKASS